MTHDSISTLYYLVLKKKFSHGSPIKLAGYRRDIDRNAINRMGDKRKRNREKTRKVGDKAENDCQTSRRRRYSNGFLDIGIMREMNRLHSSCAFKKGKKIKFGKYNFTNKRFMK